MRAIVIEEYGGPEQLAIREVPDPEPDAGEVLVDVAACGVNRADIMQRQGNYRRHPVHPDCSGLSARGASPGSVQA